MLWDDEQEDDEGVKLCHGLWRTEQKTFDPNPTFVIDEEDLAGEQETRLIGPRSEGALIAPEIKFLEFKYFDGATWWDNWQLMQGNSLPMMVRVTLGFTPLPPEKEEELELVEDNFLRDEEEREPLEDDKFTMFVRLVQSDVNPIGVRIQREGSAFGDSERAM